MARVAKLVLQLAVVSEQQQSLAVAVESTGGIDAGRLNVVGERRATLAVGELRQHSVGLIEEDEHYSSSVSSCA